MVPGLEIRERDPVLSTEVDPLIRQPDHPVGDPVAAWGAEVERAKIQRQDVGAVVEKNLIPQPVRHRTGGRHTHDLDARQRDTRRLAAPGQASGIENVEAARAAEAHPAVAQPEVRPGVELLALQTVLAMIGLHRACLRVVAHQSGIAAQPDPAAGIREDAIDRVAGEPLRARDAVEVDRVGVVAGPDHPHQTPAIGAEPEAILRIDRDGIHRVDGQSPRIAGVVAKHFDDCAVGPGQVEATAIRTDPEVAAAVLGNRRHVRGADRAGRRGTERQLPDEAGHRIEQVHSAAVRTDPQLSRARLEDRDDARRAQAARISGSHGDRLDFPFRRELLHSARHRADPQRTAMVEVQGHDARVTDGVGPTGQGIDRGGDPAVAIEQSQPAAERADPHLVVRSVSEGSDLQIARPFGAVDTQLPAARIPAADAAVEGADPHETGLVLVQRHDEGVAQRAGIRRILLVMAELRGRPIQQVQAAGSADPQMSSLILQQSANVVVRQRAAAARIVTEALHDPPIMIHPIQAAVEGAHPQRAAAILENLRHLAAAQGGRVATLVAPMGECPLLGLPAIDALVGADPERSGTIDRQRLNAIATQTARCRRIVAQVLEAARRRIEDVDARIERADP